MGFFDKRMGKKKPVQAKNYQKKKPIHTVLKKKGFFPNCPLWLANRP